MHRALPIGTVPQHAVITMHRETQVPMTAVEAHAAAMTVDQAIARTPGLILRHAIAGVTIGVTAAAGATVLIRRAPTAATPHGVIRHAVIPTLAAAAVTRQATIGAHAPTRRAVAGVHRAVEAILLQAEAVAGVTPHRAGAVAEATLLRVGAAVAGAAVAEAVAAVLPAQAGAAVTRLNRLDFV